MIIKELAINLPPIYNWCREQFKNKCTDEIISYESNPFKEHENISPISLLSDNIRVEWLCETGETGYKDADSLCAKYPKWDGWKKDKPWVAGRGKYLNGSIIFSLNCPEVFREMREDYKALEYKGAGWYQNMINSKKYRDRFYMIPEGYFITPCLNVINQEFISFATDEYCIRKENGVARFTYIKGVLNG